MGSILETIIELFAYRFKAKKSLKGKGAFIFLLSTFFLILLIIAFTVSP